MKTQKEKTMEREKFYYVNGNYNTVLWIQVKVIHFVLEGIPYLYKSCPIDKARESYSV